MLFKDVMAAKVLREKLDTCLALNQRKKRLFEYRARKPTCLTFQKQTKSSSAESGTKKSSYPRDTKSLWLEDLKSKKYFTWHNFYTYVTVNCMVLGVLSKRHIRKGDSN